MRHGTTEPKVAGSSPAGCILKKGTGSVRGARPLFLLYYSRNSLVPPVAILRLDKAARSILVGRNSQTIFSLTLLSHSFLSAI